MGYHPTAYIYNQSIACGTTDSCSTNHSILFFLGLRYGDGFQVADSLSVLPSVVSPMLTYRGVADDQEGNSWTMSFSSNEGAVAQLVCVTEKAFAGYCEVISAFLVVCHSRRIQTRIFLFVLQKRVSLFSRVVDSRLMCYTTRSSKPNCRQVFWCSTRSKHPSM